MQKEKSKKILLSICFIGRNDDYSVNFKKRLELSINYLALNAKKLKILDHLELVLVDWGSQELPLYKEISLSEEARAITKTIVVSPKETQAYNHKDSEFSHVVPSNLGLRSASGKYVAMMPADILISSFTLENIYKLLKNKLELCFKLEESILAVPRKLIPSQFEDTVFENAPEKLDKFFLYNDWYFKNEIPHPGILGAYGLMIFHKSIFAKLRGWNEKLGGWGLQDTEFGIRANCFYPIVNLSSYGIFVYDFEPNSKCFKEKFDRMNIVNDIVFEVNDDKWGFNDIKFEEINLKNTPQIKSTKQNEEKSFKLAFFNNKKILKFILKNIFNIDNYCLLTMLLAKFSLYRKPLKYLEIGTAKNCSKIISLINPLTELYLIPPVSKNDYNYFIKTSKYSQHMGALRYVPGNTNTGLERLKASFIGEMYFDLILFEEINEELDLPGIDKLVKYLSDKGTLLINISNYKNFLTVKEHLLAQYNINTIVCNEKYKVLVLVKGANNIDNGNQLMINKLIFAKYFCVLSESILIKSVLRSLWLKMRGATSH